MTFWVGLSVSRQKELTREVQTLSVTEWTASLSGLQTGPAPCPLQPECGSGALLFEAHLPCSSEGGNSNQRPEKR